MYQLPSSLSLSSLSYACARNLRPPRGAPDDTRGGVRIAGGETSQSTHRWRAYGRKEDRRPFISTPSPYCDSPIIGLRVEGGTDKAHYSSHQEAVGPTAPGLLRCAMGPTVFKFDNYLTIKLG